MNIESLAQALMAVLIPAFPYLLKGLKVAGESDTLATARQEFWANLFFRTSHLQGEIQN